MRMPFFTGAERLWALRAAVLHWDGTPFHPHGEVPGANGGCSCQTLVTGIYKDCTFLPQDFKAPTGSIRWARAQKVSIMETFLDGEAAELFDPITSAPQAGDLLGFRIGGCVHHLGVMFDNSQFIHCLERYGVSLARIDDATYSGRLKRIWRPVK